MNDELFQIENPNEGKTCLTCVHRQRWGYEFSVKVTQRCALQPTRRNGVGLKRIKVTDKACKHYKED